MPTVWIGAGAGTPSSCQLLPHDMLDGILKQATECTSRNLAVVTNAGIDRRASSCVRPCLVCLTNHAVSICCLPLVGDATTT